MAHAPVRKMRYAEYQAFERASETKHEFVDGEIDAMSGGSFSHSLVAANLIAELGIALRGSPCRPLTSDMRVRTPEDAAFYPDVSVVFGPPELSDDVRDELLNPTLIVEAMSPTSELRDRVKKFRKYKAIPSFREYVLVSTSERRIDVFSKQEDGAWLLREYAAGGVVELASVGAKVSVDAVYDGAEMEGG